MFFFGTKTKIVSGQMFQGLQCPSCENREFITFGVIRYFHLYWIPTFVTSKSVGIECTHCKKNLIDKDLPTELLGDIKANVFNKKNTIPMFSGLIIILCLALFIINNGRQDNMKEAAYIEQPIINDLYIVNFNKIFSLSDKNYKYGAMRIKSIQSGQVELQISEIVYDKTSGVRKDIRERKTSMDAYYDSEPIYMDLDKLKTMKESGAIHSIERM